MCVRVCVCAGRDGLSDESATAAHCKLFNKATADRIMGKQLYVHIVHSHTHTLADSRQKTDDTEGSRQAGRQEEGIHSCAQQYGNLSLLK